MNDPSSAIAILIFRNMLNSYLNDKTLMYIGGHWTNSNFFVVTVIVQSNVRSLKNIKDIENIKEHIQIKMQSLFKDNLDL